MSSAHPEPTPPPEPAAGARKPPSVRILARSFRYVTPYWRTILIAILLMVVYAGFNTVRVGMVGLLLDGVVFQPDPARGQGKIVGYYKDWVAPWLPFDLHVSERFGQSNHVLSATIESGTLKGDPTEVQGSAGGWLLQYEQGRLRGLVPDNDKDGAADGPAQEIAFQTALVRVERLPPSLAPPLEIANAIVTTQTGEVLAQDEMLRVLLGFAVVGAILALIIASSHFGQEVLSQNVIVHSAVRLRADLFQKISELSVDYFGKRRAGDLISRLTNDVGAIQLSLRFVFGDLIQQPLIIVSALVLAIGTSWKFSVVTLPFLLLLSWPVLKSGPRVKKHGRGSLARLGEVTQVMAELLSGIRVVKAFHMEFAQQEEFARKNEGFVKSNLKMVRAKAWGRSVLEFLYNLLAAVILAIGGWVLVGGFLQITIADFATLLVAISMMYQPLRAVSKAYNTIQESIAGAERVFEVMDEQPSIRDRPGARPFPRHQESIEFDGVWFRYRPELPWVLRDLRFRVARGATVAFVGVSGAGKTTILDLVARYGDPVEGRITLDGVDLRDGTHASLLAQIAIVGQDPFLFSTTILENIGFGRPGATESEIIEAAKAAAIHDEVMALPQGYRTVLGDRGVGLSGGQRQRITIARAILKNAEILILDEATSSLDSESERKVQAALANLMRDRTTFVVAHRLSTIRAVDRIYVLEQGSIVEQGTHDELAARDGPYARLLRMQDHGGVDDSTASVS